MDEFYLFTGKVVILLMAGITSSIALFYTIGFILNMIVKIFFQWSVFVKYLIYRKEFNNWLKLKE
jgi:hypothetical protein